MVTGGAGRFVRNTIETSDSLLSGVAPPANIIPFKRQHIRDVTISKMNQKFRKMWRLSREKNLSQDEFDRLAKMLKDDLIGKGYSTKEYYRKLKSIERKESQFKKYQREIKENQYKEKQGIKR